MLRIGSSDVKIYCHAVVADDVYDDECEYLRKCYIFRKATILVEHVHHKMMQLSIKEFSQFSNILLSSSLIHYNEFV